MCIAILKPEGKIISKETLQQCFNSNPDGAGFIHIEDGMLKVNKGYFTFDKFWKAYERHQEKQVVIHFRIMTHGQISIENCHPFYISEDVAFVHNGIISEHGGNKDKSDTRDFNEKILRPLVKRFGPSIIQEASFQKLVEDYIGFSKLVFMDVNGNYAIFNENKGEWADGVWYSNGSYKVVKQWSYTNDDDYMYNYPVKASKWYLRKAMGKRIDEGDYAKLNWSYKGMNRGDIVVVKKIAHDSFCEVELDDSSVITGVPGNYLDVIDFDDIMDVRH